MTTQSSPRPVGPIHVPDEWHDHDLLTFGQFCDLIQIPARTVRDWRRRHVGPCWTKLEGTGRLYITVGETRRFLLVAATTPLGRSVGATAQPEEKTA